jgi:hypothetical protein
METGREVLWRQNEKDCLIAPKAKQNQMKDQFHTPVILSFKTFGLLGTTGISIHLMN